MLRKLILANPCAYIESLIFFEESVHPNTVCLLDQFSYNQTAMKESRLPALKCRIKTKKFIESTYPLPPTGLVSFFCANPDVVKRTYSPGGSWASSGDRHLHRMQSFAGKWSALAQRHTGQSQMGYRLSPRFHWAKTLKTPIPGCRQKWIFFATSCRTEWLMLCSPCRTWLWYMATKWSGGLFGKIF